MLGNKENVTYRAGIKSPSEAIDAWITPNSDVTMPPNGCSSEAKGSRMRDSRLSMIRHFLFEKTSASIHEIAEAVGASLPTVRRDLLTLELEGAICRTHGGASIADSASRTTAFEVQEQICIDAKRAIGLDAHTRLEPNVSVFLGAGTTVLQLARSVRMHPLPVAVFTNSLAVAEILTGIREVAVTLIGGRLNSRGASTGGTLAEGLLERLWFDRLFLGASVIGKDGYIYSADEEEARLHEKLIGRSARSTILADASKFGRHATYRIAQLNGCLDVISDDRLPETWLNLLISAGCSVRLSKIHDEMESPSEDTRA